jgi:glycerophosphoryl diester phosphodiesterase
MMRLSSLPLLMAVLLTALAHAQVVPIPEGHSHNDYWKWRPLQRALANGFMSVEADVHLRHGDLLVNHEAIFTRRGRNLDRLYLRPLYERAKANGFSSVYPEGPQEFILYIDIKQGCPDICDTLIAQLGRYEKMLTVWENSVKRTGAVSIIIGACGREEEWLSASRRWFYFDGNSGALGGRWDADAVPRLSVSFRGVTSWRGSGQMDIEERERLRSMIGQAKAEGRKIRFWGATNRRKVWSLLLDEGCEVINVDRLARFRRFMGKRNARPAG